MADFDDTTDAQFEEIVNSLGSVTDDGLFEMIDHERKSIESAGGSVVPLGSPSEPVFSEDSVFFPTEEGIVVNLPNEIMSFIAQVMTSYSVSFLLGERPDILFPRLYEDAEQEAEYRALVDEDLVSFKSENVRVVLRFLSNGATVISAEELSSWIHALNDARLFLAADLDVTDSQVLNSTPHGAAYQILSAVLSEAINASGFDQY